MTRILSAKEYERMTNGKWRQYSFDWNKLRETKNYLKAMEVEFKHYLMTTNVRGYYQDVILVKR